MTVRTDLTIKDLVPAMIEIASIQADLCRALRSGVRVDADTLQTRGQTVIRWLLEQLNETPT